MSALTEFIASNPAKDFRDGILFLYDELIGVKLSNGSPDVDLEVSLFFQKAATLALNSLKDKRQEFLKLYT